MIPHGPQNSRGMRMGGKKIHTYIYMCVCVCVCVCDRSVACSRPDPSGVLTATHIVAQCRRLADYAFSGETQRSPPETPTSVKLGNQTHWSHFGE